MEQGRTAGKCRRENNYSRGNGCKMLLVVNKGTNLVCEFAIQCHENRKIIAHSCYSIIKHLKWTNRRNWIFNKPESIVRALDGNQFVWIFAWKRAHSTGLDGVQVDNPSQTKPMIYATPAAHWATSDRSFTVWNGLRISSVSLSDVQWPSKNLGAVRTCNGAVGRVLTAASMTWQLGGSLTHSLAKLLVLASCIMITVGLHDIRPDPKRPAPALPPALLQPEENNFYANANISSAAIKPPHLYVCVYNFTRRWLIPWVYWPPVEIETLACGRSAGQMPAGAG